MVYAVGLLATSPLWAVALWRTGKWRTDWAGRFGRGAAVPRAAGAGADGAGLGAGPRPRVLVHAVSVGEVNATRGLVAALVGRGAEVVVSATTNTGYARAAGLFDGMAGVAGVVRFPLDFSVAVGRFLDRVRPDAVALVELEVWPNFVAACDRRGVPVVVVNGRLSGRSFAGYRWARWALGRSFGRLAAVGAQTSEYAVRFEAMGVAADRVSVLDTVKWDGAPGGEAVAALEAEAGRLAAAMGVDRARPLVVAGSTGPGEPGLLVAAWRAGLASGAWPRGTQLLVAPRKPEWFDAAARAMRAGGAAGGAVGGAVGGVTGEAGLVRRSAAGAAGAAGGAVDAGGHAAGSAGLFLLDTIGALQAAYALADVVVVGRSLMGDLYGSDCMEPAALGKATLIGPHHDDFADTVEALVAGDGLAVVAAEGLGEAVGALLRDEARREAMGASARAVVEERRGASERYAALVMGVMDRV